MQSKLLAKKVVAAKVTAADIKEKAGFNGQKIRTQTIGGITVEETIDGLKVMYDAIADNKKLLKDEFGVGPILPYEGKYVVNLGGYVRAHAKEFAAKWGFAGLTNEDREAGEKASKADTAWVMKNAPKTGKGGEGLFENIIERENQVADLYEGAKTKASKVTALDTPLHSFTNDEEGMKASIYKNTGNALKGQFNVVFSDIDSGKTAGTKTFPKEEDAVAYAKKLTKQKVTASDTDKFDPATSGEFTDKNKAPLEENKDLAKMIFAQIYVLQDGRLNPVEQKYFNDRAECKAYCEERNLEFEVRDNPNKPSEKKVTAISKKDSRGIVQSAVAMETLITKLTAGSLVSKTMVPYFRSLTNNAKHLYWQTHGVPYAQPQSKIFASKNEARSEIAKIEAILLTMSKGVEGMAKISVNNMFKDIKAIKTFLQGGLI